MLKQLYCFILGHDWRSLGIAYTDRVEGKLTQWIELKRNQNNSVLVFGGYTVHTDRCRFCAKIKETVVSGPPPGSQFGMAPKYNMEKVG